MLQVHGLWIPCFATGPAALVTFLLCLDNLYAIGCIVIAVLGRWASPQALVVLFAGVWMAPTHEGLLLVQLVCVGLFHAPIEDWARVAVAGTLGSLVAAASIRKADQTIVYKLVCALTVPLVCIEGTLAYFYRDSVLSWFIHFVRKPEIPLYGSHETTTWLRWHWVLYWAIIFPLAVILAPTFPNKTMARKWFHGAAVLLFGPATVYAPRLQALAYAVALSLLVLIEGLRSDIPVIHAYYDRYIRPEERLVVSHLALIFGCAVPLWLALALDKPDWALQGVWTVGIGDAIGATVGSVFGRRRWSATNRRTREGSLAMLLVLLVFCKEYSLPWILTAVVVTYVEATTTLLDNLLLPVVSLATFEATTRAMQWYA